MSNDATKPPLPDPFTLIWRWLNSLPVAIGAMLALAVLSAIGTVIPQEHLVQAPMGQTFEAVLAERYGQLQLNLIMRLGLHHIYFTWYFFLLLLWVSVSAFACNITRFKRTLSLWRKPPLAGDKGVLHSKHALTTEDASAAQVDALAGELRARRFRVREEEQAGVRHIYADKGFTKLWGLMLLHLAILLLLAGGVLGKVFGVEGMIAMADGESKVLSLDLAENKHPFVAPLLRNLPHLEYKLSQNHFRIDYDRKITVPAMITEHVPEDLQDYYRYFVKQYISCLEAEALHTGEVVETEVSVNHPLIVDKLNLYQSSYVQRGYLVVEINGEEQEYIIPPSGAMLVAPDGCFVESMGGWFSLDPENNFAAATPADPSSAAMLICEQVKAGDLYVGGEHTGYLGPMTIATTASPSGGMGPRQIITPDSRLKLVLGGGVVATLHMSERVDNTSVFSYKRDPGLPLLYLGWIAMIIGITIALYIPFTQVRLRAEGSRIALLITGASGVPGGALKRQLHAILEQQ